MTGTLLARPGTWHTMAVGPPTGFWWGRVADGPCRPREAWDSRQTRSNADCPCAGTLEISLSLRKWSAYERAAG